MALLYPIMQMIVPFYEYRDISNVLVPFQRAMSYDINDNKYMPVSRELSD
jgi:hypothetical protein